MQFTCAQESNLLHITKLLYIIHRLIRGSFRLGSK